MLIIRRYKKNRDGKYYWEFKIRYLDVFTRKYKTRQRGSFRTREEAMAAAYDLAEVLHLPISDVITRD